LSEQCPAPGASQLNETYQALALIASPRIRRQALAQAFDVRSGKRSALRNVSNGID
jgi:hypothetical protein